MRLGLLVVLLLSATAARAQDWPPVSPGVAVELSVSPLVLPTGVVAPGDTRYLYELTLGMTTWLGVEVIADRRLLSFDVTAPGARRALHCTDPTRPRFTQRGMRVRALGPAGGPAETRSEEHASTYSEWIDLRAYCTGAALAALDAGAHVVPRYGFASGPRGTWVARSTELPEPDARSTRELVGQAFDVPPRPLPPTPAGDALVTLAPVDREVQQGMTLRVSVRTREARARRVYLRTDQIRFRVRSALGTSECGLPSERHGVVADFFTRIDRRRAATLTLDAGIVCHDAFPLSGIYEVTPLVSLPYRAPAPHDADSLTGELTGAPAVVRIRRGDRGYVEQLVEDLAAAGARS